MYIHAYTYKCKILKTVLNCERMISWIAKVCGNVTITPICAHTKTRTVIGCFVTFLLSTFSLLERFSATFWKVAVGIGPLEFYMNLVHNSIVMMEQVCSALVAVKGNCNATIYKRNPR